MSRLARFPFAERDDAILPSDAEGTVLDLEAAPVLPSVVDGLTGPGRELGSGVGLAGELDGAQVFTGVAVAWVSDVNVLVAGDTITKNAGGSGYNAGAVSAQSAAGDCFVEFSIGAVGDRLFCGLSVGDTNQDYVDVDFAICCRHDNILEIYESGAFILTGPLNPDGPLSVFRVMRIGSEITYWQKHGSSDWVLIHTSAVASSGVLLVDTSIHEEGDAVTATFYTGDAADSGVRMDRDLTVQALVSLDLAGMATMAAMGVLAGAGRRFGTEGAAWQLQLRLYSATLRLVGVRLGWSADSEEDPDVAGAGWEFFVAPASGWLLITATRHWLSSSSVRVRYYVGDVLLGEVTSTYGDITGDDPTPFTVGCRPSAIDAYDSELEATIDDLLVTDHEMSAEEVRQVYRRIAVHQPDGRKILRPLLAAGKAYSLDPDSGIQRELAVEGDGLGEWYSRNQELREDYLPDRAWSVLDDWERVCRLPPAALDTVETRRNRVTSFLRKVHGYSEEQVKVALAAALGLDSADVEIRNYTNRYLDGFDGAAGDTYEDWWSEVAPVGTIAVDGSGALEVTLDAAADGRISSKSDTAGPTILRLPVDGEPARDADPAVGLDLEVKVVSDLSAHFDPGDHVGIFAWTAGNDWVFLGFRSNAGVIELGVRLYVGGVLSAWVPLDTPLSPPAWIRLRYEGGTAWRVYWSTTAAKVTANATAITGPTNPANAGIGIMQDVASNPNQTVVLLDDFRCYQPLGLRPFCWWAYADPTLSASPDLPGARAIVAQLKPADSHGGAIATEYIECGDAGCGCGEGPVT